MHTVFDYKLTSSELFIYSYCFVVC